MAFGLIIQHRFQVPLGGGRNGSEYPAGINRNQWPECVGIRICLFWSVLDIKMAQYPTGFWVQ